ncbi:MAG: peptide chain release factor N(5)-glutamine methyltransferase [Paludibacteraceae bacterium]|nr:peptide chain release factor N(5)-glutamine methyltransferase [Paludibacteraceae bacterium]
MSPTVGYITRILSDVYPQDEARALALWLVEELTGKSRGELLLRQEPLEIHDLDVYLRRLLEREPVQYIFGKTEWMGLGLRVTQDTLIPRPETGELVEWVIQDTAALSDGERPPLRVVDIGTGSGCIAIALKRRFPDWDVCAWDISEAALRIAQENAARNGVSIRFSQKDITEAEEDSPREGCPFDIVVSNPPYVMEKEKAAMEENVLRYEPAAALFVPDNDPLLFYRAIIRKRLAPTLYFEINERMGSAVQDLLLAEGYADVIVRKDTYGKNRMVRGKLNN